MEVAFRPGYVNLNGQRNLGPVPGPADKARSASYLLRCEGCGHTYGSRSGDLRRRRCPKCQTGTPGRFKSGPPLLRWPR
jgi:hypothetical protein